MPAPGAQYIDNTIAHGTIIVYCTTTPVLIALGVLSLANRRNLANLLFLSKLLSNRIDSPPLFSKIYFRVDSHNTRSFVPFHIYHFSSNFLLNISTVRHPRSADIDSSFFLFLINFTTYVIAISLFSLFNLINCVLFICNDHLVQLNLVRYV